jgi:transcriptional regulator with XRE-family HTH domain
VGDAPANNRKKESTKVNGAIQDMRTFQNGQSLNGGQRALHRVSQVREREGISLQSISRRWKMEISRLRELENESTDLTLSQLYQWQQVLEVPVSELLVELDQPLSAPVLRRAQMIRLMKTAVTIAHKTRSSTINQLAKMLMDQLVSMMPELERVGPWQDEPNELRRDRVCAIGDLTTDNELNV